MTPKAHIFYACISTQNTVVVSSKAKLLWPLYTSLQAIYFPFAFFFFFVSVIPTLLYVM